MTFLEYNDEALSTFLEVRKTVPSIRMGQCYYNTLYRLRPDIANKMPESSDAFYNDTKLVAFLLFAADEWNKNNEII